MQTSWSIGKQECAVNIERCTQEPSANHLALVKQYFFKKINHFHKSHKAILLVKKSSMTLVRIMHHTISKTLTYFE